MKGQDQFFAFKTKILDYIDTFSIKCDNVPSLKDHFRTLVDYTTAGGKCHRGLLAVYGFLAATGYDPDSKEAEPGYALGWIQEIFQASFLIPDDIMDNGTLRRGKPCWHLVEGKSCCAVSDGYFLENMLYYLIDHYFSYASIQTRISMQNIICQTTLYTSIGQYIDNAPKEPTLKNWELTVLNKTAYYSIWQPFLSGLIASEKIPADVLNSPTLKEALLIAGVLFQCQDDWLDLYSNTQIMGKVGSDIQDGKVTWLFAKAIELANEQQKAALLANVGSKDEEKVNIVRKIYEELNINQECQDYQEKLFKEFKEKAESFDPRIPKELTQFLIQFLDHRSH